MGVGDVGYVARVFSCLIVYLSPFLCLLVVHAVTLLFGEVREKGNMGHLEAKGVLQEQKGFTYCWKN